jgi:adenylosuccinate synthase
VTFTIVVLSGPVSSGKSTLAERLADRYGAVHLRTRELMAAHAHARGDALPMDRAALQRYGERLDVQTKGRWVVDGLAPTINRLGRSGLFIIDAIRIPAQLEALRDAFGRDVVHVHLRAPLEVLD